MSAGELLTIAEVAALLRKSKSAVYKLWPSWVKYGVRPIRFAGHSKGSLLFARSEVEAMLEQWRIVPPMDEELAKGG